MKLVQNPPLILVMLRNQPNRWLNLEDVCDIRKKMSIVQGNRQRNRDDNRETLGTSLRCLVVRKKIAEQFTRFAKKEETAELPPKNTATTAIIHLDGWHLLFGEYLQKWISLYREIGKNYFFSKLTSGRNPPNPAIWLVPRAGGILRSCPLTC